jgi:flagellar FliL protein
MAKAAQSGEEKKSSGGLVGIVIVTLLAAGAGGGLGFYLSGNLKEKEPPKKAAASKKEEEKPKVAVGTRLVEMTPIIVNLAEPKTAWIRVEASLVIDRDLEEVQALMGKISEDITAYLRSTTLSQFEGGSGFQNLREDLNERARLRGGKEIKELVVHGLVVE